ncbi:MAG: hypothetical protein E7311_01140 [Clostridiales bacterium]|nr:hypothetical protein [Clostridiales bacterium]
MATFIGAEYVIANLFIEKSKRKLPQEVSIKEINVFSNYLQKKANSSNIDAIFLTSYYQICNSIYNYPEYFIFDKKKEIIYLKKGCDNNSLESRFYGYLSLEVLKFMTLETIDFLDNNLITK